MILGGLACTPAPFACLDDSACSGGRCEPSGWCSFDDDACASGRRYGHWAGDGLADTCVDGSIAGTGSTTGAGTTTSTTGLPATTAVTEAMETSGLPGSSGGGPSTGAVDTSSGDGPNPTELVAWYPFDADAPPGVIVDAVGEHPGTCLPDECPAPIDGILGTAARFDGIDDLVRVAHDDGLDLGGTWTAAAWMLPGLGDGYQNLLGKPVTVDGLADSIELAITAEGSAIVGTASIDDGGSIWAPVELSPDKWIHLAGSFDGTTLRLYVDAQVVGEAAAPAPYYSELEWTIGAGIDLGVPDTHFTGVIDEVRLYRGVLTAEEIAAIAGVP